MTQTLGPDDQPPPCPKCGASWEFRRAGRIRPYWRPSAELQPVTYWTLTHQPGCPMVKAGEFV